MNKITKVPGILAALVVALCVFSACNKDNTEYKGTRISDESRFILDFEILNSSETHSMTLANNDIIDVVIISENGEINLLVSDSEGYSVYRADKASSGEFSLEITAAGIYEFMVSGKHASGLVSFILK